MYQRPLAMIQNATSEKIKYPIKDGLKEENTLKLENTAVNFLVRHTCEELLRLGN